MGASTQCVKHVQELTAAVAGMKGCQAASQLVVRCPLAARVANATMAAIASLGQLTAIFLFSNAQSQRSSHTTATHWVEVQLVASSTALCYSQQCAVRGSLAQCG
jgi:hypothetical protein